MFNPWIILAVVVAIAMAGIGGFYKGTEYQKGEDAKAQLEAVNKAVADANAQAAKDKNLAVVQAQRNTAAQTRAALVRSQANAAISAHPQSAACDWDKPSFDSLRSAIAAANGDANGTGSVSDAVRRANASGKQQGGRDQKLDDRRDKPAR